MPATLRTRATSVPDENEVHVWIAAIADFISETRSLEDLLTREELLKADRFVRPEDRNRTIIARGVLRLLLASYLKLSPHEVRIERSAHGKPALGRGQGNDSLRFNLSHSGEVVVFAATNTCSVGIDIEQVRSDINVLELAAAHFASGELSTLRSTAEADRTEAFYRCWTRKEAYLKACGDGLTFDLKKFSVTVDSSEPAALTWVADDPTAPLRWSIRDVSVPNGYIGSLAVEGHSTRSIVRHCGLESGHLVFIR